MMAYIVILQGILRASKQIIASGKAICMLPNDYCRKFLGFVMVENKLVFHRIITRGKSQNKPPYLISLPLGLSRIFPEPATTGFKFLEIN